MKPEPITLSHTVVNCLPQKETHIEPQHTLPPLQTPTRIDILSALWQDFKELQQIRRDLRDKELTKQLRQQIYMYQVESQMAKVMLSGMPQQLEVKEDITSEETINVITTTDEDAVLSEAARILERKTKPQSIH